MLTRLKVTGFKNLVDVDVRFGPFTCIAGPNGVGKSNLFDAIRFLSALAEKPLIEAALSVRDESGRAADMQSLFHRHGNTYMDKMTFEAEMIIPKEGIDDLGQKAEATITFLRYSLALTYRKNDNFGSLGALELNKEELVHISRTEAHKHLLFNYNASKWRDSAVIGKRSGGPFISTVQEGNNRIIKLHQDGGSRGRPLAQAANLPRTILSATNASESPTALLARREMQSWRLLQLEPSALRKPDDFSAPTKLDSNGLHLPACLYRLACHNSSKVYSQIANRLAQLIEDVYDLSIERDEKRELLTLYINGKDKTSYAARSLSDGTLRFLALAVLAQDPEFQGALCLEEPENGIHPERIPAMIQLLNDIATDVHEPIGPDNPLRQVIINTHSPAVVQQVAEDSLLVAELKEVANNNKRFRGVQFSCLPGTWREKKPPYSEKKHICSKGKLLAYLNPVLSEDEYSDIEDDRSTRKKPRRVIDREDAKQLLMPWGQK
ncbi:MAG: ATPase [Phycisphaerae bacterium SM23_30]|nr:MAG: ATPase [Phycisphaerae bacterium SM23_30]